MDDTGSIVPLKDVAFTFNYIETHGPQYGLYLNKTKCQIILATNGQDPLPYIDPNIANNIHQAANKYCKGQISLNGTVLLGTPIGNDEFVQQYLHEKLNLLKDKIDRLQTHVVSPATCM